MARKTPKRSRMETSRMEPRTTERIRVRYSGASPVPPDHRAAARTAKNALPAITSLKYSAKLSTTYPPPKNSPENPAASRPGGAPEDGEGADGRREPPRGPRSSRKRPR
jgi:hypothetical protein